MEENGDKFEIKNDTKAYKITLKKFICIILIIIIFVALIVYSIFKMYYEREGQESLNEKNIGLEQVLGNLENRTAQEKTEEDFEEDVNYDYSDFLNSDDIEIYDADYYEDDYYEEYDITENYRWNAELAVQFIYGLRANPLYVISNEFYGYTLLKNSEKQADGSYNIKIDFEDLSEIVYFNGFHPSCLKTNEDLKNNINVLSQEQINVKDTGIDYEYYAVALSFEKIENNKYTGYFSIEEYDEDSERSVTKYAEVTAEFNQNTLVTNIECKEVSEDTVPEELIYNYDDYSDYDYSYSDYISQ